MQWRELKHAGHDIAFRGEGRQFELKIDGVVVPMVSHLGPSRFATMIFPHEYFPTAEAMAKHLAETEGRLWVLEKEGATVHKTKPRK